MGKTPGAITRLCDAAAINHAEIIAEHEAEGIRHGLDNLDATCTELAKVLDAAIDTLRPYGAPGEGKDPTKPYKITRADFGMVQAINTTANTLGKFRQWGNVTKIIGDPEHPLVSEIRCVIVDP